MGLFLKACKYVFKKNLDVFHLDVGDGKFINRTLEVTDKLKYIKKISINNIVHLH